MKIIRHPLFMRPTPESELEQWLDRELRGLPARRAPADLIPGVLRAVAEYERRPWWQRSYAQWPAPARVLFLALASGLAGLLVYFTWGLSAGATWGALGAEIGELMGRWESARNLGGALGGAALALGRAGGAWLIWGAAGVLGACYVTTLALGTACYRLAVQKS